MMKLFNTINMQFIEFCREQEQFNFILPSRQIANRRDKFIKSASQRTNVLTLFNMYRVGQKSDTSRTYITLYERYHFFGPTGRYYCYAAYMSCLDKYMPFICVFFLLFFSFLS